MTLHKIILENFKSYKGTHTIGPFDPFSCIVGLNGSGKSNLMDAVCFAVTVSSSFLRANNLLDIINKDSAQAYVELYLQNTTNKENDPTANTKEYTILKRTINNKCLSNYYIDSKNVSYTDYLAFLHSINIYPKSKNYLIFQGEVDSISLKEPKEITKLVEEISGSVKYKKEYEAKEEKMNLLFAECQKMFEKRKEMNSRLKEIAEGKENEKKFKEKIRMKDELYAKVKLCELKEKVENMHKTEKCIEVINKRREDVRNKIKCMKAVDDNSNLKVIKEMMEIENDIENLMYEIKEASKKEIDSQVSKGNVEHIKKRIESANDALVKKSKRKEIIKKEIDNAQKMYENEMRQIEKKYKKIVIDDAVKDKYFELENLYQNKAKELIEKMEENKLEVKPSKDKIKMLELNNKDLKANLQRYKDEIQAVKIEVDNAEYKVKINDANINVIRNKQRGSLNAFEKIANEEKDLNNKLATCIKEILAIKSIRKESEKKLRINDCIEHLKLNFAGVHGKVVDLVTVTQKKYETAVSVLMSGFDQAVIVDNDKVAIKCIEYVKEQKIGRITFLPLSVLKQKEIDYNYRKDCIMAVDTVNCDKTIQKAVSFVLGNSLIAKDINEAKDLLYIRSRKTKICTLDGVLFHKNGNITGGRIENKFTDSNLSKFLAQKNDIMNKLQNIKIKKSAYSHVEAASEKIAALEKDNIDLLRYIEQEKTKLKFLQEKIDKFESTIHENASEIAKLEKIICSKTNKINKLEIELQNIETSVFKDFIYAKNLKDFKDLLFNSDNVISNAGKEIKKMIDRLKNELETLETEVRGIEENLQLLNSQLELATQTGGTTQQTKALNDILDRKRNDLTKIKSNFKASKVKMDKVKTELQKLSNQMSALDIDACEQSKKLARIRDDVLGIVKMSMIEEVIFPSKNNDFDDQNLFTIEMSEETILKNIGQIDFDQIKEDIDFYTNQYQQIVKDIEDTMPMSKLKDASKSQTNYGKINSDYDELRKEALIAKEEFNTVKNKRIDAFMSCYNVISQSIGDIYRQLTKREDVEGNAYLLLENNTEPYKDGLKYFTMPPSKRYREMQALSGGEKTMAALALLFSIHAYKPAPFYLFDEMDSALDKMNVSSIVDYIASTNVQFIIITLKPSFFQHSDGLIGIYKSNNTSKVLTYRFE